MYRRVPILFSACLLMFALTAQSRTAEPNKLTDKVKEGEPVPSPLTFSSRFERIVIVRMTYGTDMLGGLVKAVKQEVASRVVDREQVSLLDQAEAADIQNTPALEFALAEPTSRTLQARFFPIYDAGGDNLGLGLLLGELL